jgi:hypothetical protein
VATVEVRLKLSDSNELTSEIVDDGQNEKFNRRDAKDFSDLQSKQKDAKRFTHERKQNNGKVPKGKRVNTDDYSGEPAYAHAGIHLVYKHDDQLVFSCNKKVNIVIEITADPELYLVRDVEGYDPSVRLSKNELLDRKRSPAHFPFAEPKDPLMIVHGEATAPLKLKREGNGKPDDDVLAQQYYKFSATVMGAPSITLDPHIEIHVDD